MSTSAPRESVRQQRSFVAARLATYRRQILRILIADINAAEVEHSVQELKRAQFAVSADVVHSEKQFVERLRARWRAGGGVGEMKKPHVRATAVGLSTTVAVATYAQGDNHLDCGIPP